MTKFLDDQWCADRDIIEMKDMDTWWAEEKVSSLEISAPLSILPSVTVEQAIDIMVREGFDQLPVITESGKIVGVATMGSLKAKLLKGKVNATDPVEAVTYSTFKKLNLETTLSKLSRVLDTEHFALVVHNQRLYTNDRDIQEREVIVGILTDIDLIHYIARHEAGSGSGEASSASGESSPQPRNKSSSEASN